MTTERNDKTPMKVQQVLDLIDSRDLALPEFQRGYVWNREQVRQLMTSLYKGYPVGSFMVWHTTNADAAQRGGSGVDGNVKLLLDGQQRATTLYGVIRGKPPKFFEGNAQKFTGLHFNVVNEAFEFYAPTKMKDDPTWIDVTELMTTGPGPYIQPLNQQSSPIDPATLFGRLNRVWMIKEKDIHLEEVTGADKDIDVVVDIFDKVNSGGTKLSKGDLALAKICAYWPEARQEMNTALATWSRAGFEFSLDWLLRVINAVGTGKIPFTALETLTTTQIQEAFTAAKKYVSAWLDVISGRLGLDHTRVLFGRFALVVLARQMHVNGGSLPDAAQQSKLLYWYVNAGMWGRFAGSIESVLAQDLDALHTGGVDQLIDVIRLSRGTLEVRPEDFAVNSIGARFYPTLYMLTRAQGARDLDTGVVLSKALLGHNSSLEMHHIFPKAQLYTLGHSRGQVNAIANFCFLTKGSNLKILANRPADYMPDVEKRQPGALTSQWIPTDRALWELNRYGEFLAARRALLATATNEFLASLHAGHLPVDTTPGGAGEQSVAVTAAEEPDERTQEVDTLLEVLEAAGFGEPERDVEVAHPDTGRVLSVAEAHWPDGLQPGLGQPVVLELDDDAEFDENALTALGYAVFTSTDALLDYASTLSGEEVAEATEADEQPSPPDVSLSRDVAARMTEAERRAAFNLAMKDVYVRAKKEAGYNATAYLRMLADHGGVETARRLLASPGVSDGFVALWERDRVDLAVENVVLRPEFADLFTDEELEIARQRLREYGLDVD